MRGLVLAIAALAAACSPPAPKTEAPPGEPGIPALPSNPELDAITAALAFRVEVEIGQPVSFTATSMQINEDWAWLIAQPWTPEGTQIDWSQTRYAERASEGMLDGGGITYALFKRENGQWRVVDFAVGPTDVAWADWSERYGAPEGLMQAR